MEKGSDRIGKKEGEVRAEEIKDRGKKAGVCP